MPASGVTRSRRGPGIAVLFAGGRPGHETVMAPPFHQLDYWSQARARQSFRILRVGYTWLAREALRTGAKTPEMKR